MDSLHDREPVLGEFAHWTTAQQFGVSDYRRFRDRLAEAIDPIYGGVAYLDYLIEGCGVAKCFTSDNAAIVTRFSYFPGCKIIEGLVAAGELEEIVNVLIPAAEQYGREQGCRFATISSREGWAKVLKPAGWEPHQVTLVKEL